LQHSKVHDVTAISDPKTAARSLPADLADVALIDAKTCAAACGMSVSYWHEAVRTRRAPAPVIRQPRCTRWTMASVRAWLIERAAQPQASADVVAKATKASHAARAKRAALASAASR
jgi:predicted DNA-binding transcriptional regulator AlpA